MALTSEFHVGIKYTLTGVADKGTPTFEVNQSTLLKKLLTGTGSNQADLAFSDQRTLSASATENIDLAGSLVDQLGTTLTFVKIKGVLIVAAAGNTNNVVVGGAATNAFVGPFNDATDKVVVPPGGAFFAAAPASGWSVTAGTGDILLIANSGAGSSVTYDIYLVGTSA